MNTNNNSELLHLKQLLQEVELEQFTDKIVEKLQVSRISHFDYVTVEDLMGIGMGKPAARRLLDTVKKRKGTLRKKILQTFSQNTALGIKEKPYEKIGIGSKPEATNLTCLIKESDLKIEAQLGDGSFGIVHKGEWSRPSGLVVAVAVKVLKSDVIKKQEIYEDFVREVEAMHSLQHPSLVRLHGVVLSQPMMMVTELAPLGSLLDYLHKQCTHISIYTLWQYSTQISAGMAFLELRRLLHRDLACRNVFLTSATQAKIGDFGLLRPLPPGSDCYVMTEQRRVPFPWCAPESLKSRQFSHASDVWMFGITLWEMYTFGEEPWAGLSGHEILQKIDKNGERLRDPEAAPASVCSLLQRCWLANPAERPRFADISLELSKSTPLMVRCRTDDKSETPSWDEPAGAKKMDISSGDSIAVISGRPDFYWWKGQNQRTFDIGIFPRCWAEPMRRRNGEDISRPLRHSFIHTGHGSPSGSSWGNPAAIDDVYLRNPMEPLDILGVEDAATAEVVQEPRRPSVLPVGDLNKSKRQFNYFRLNDDAVEADSLPNKQQTRHETKSSAVASKAEELLITFDQDPPTESVVSQPAKYFAFPAPQLGQPLIPAASSDRIYANYPANVSSQTTNVYSVVEPLASSASAQDHFYSEVPVEPVYSPPPTKPAADDELRRKRDEAFSWLSTALGDISLSQRTLSSSVPNLKADPNWSCTQSESALLSTSQTGSRVSSHGFDDDFSLDPSPSVRPASYLTQHLQRRQMFQDQNCGASPIRQPVYPKPGHWFDAPSPHNSATGDLSSHCRPDNNQIVQTAHVRPFVVATPPSAEEVPQQQKMSIQRQVQLCAPWASESEVKQALVLNNSHVLQAIHYLQVEKLYRLGLCSKSLCEKALETTNWDLEKAASALLDQ